MANTAAQQTPVPAQLPHPETVLLTIKQFCSQQPGLPESSIRWAIFNEKFNGLAKSGSIVRAGRRVLIDPVAYLAWLKTNPKLSPPVPKGSSKRPRPCPILDAA